MPGSVARIEAADLLWDDLRLIEPQDLGAACLIPLVIGAMQAGQSVSAYLRCQEPFGHGLDSAEDLRVISADPAAAVELAAQVRGCGAHLAGEARRPAAGLHDLAWLERALAASAAENARISWTLLRVGAVLSGLTATEFGLLVTQALPDSSCAGAKEQALLLVGDDPGRASRIHHCARLMAEAAEDELVALIRSAEVAIALIESLATTHGRFNPALQNSCNRAREPLAGLVRGLRDSGFGPAFGEAIAEARGCLWAAHGLAADAGPMPLRRLSESLDAISDLSRCAEQLICPRLRRARRSLAPLRLTPLLEALAPAAG